MSIGRTPLAKVKWSLEGFSARCLVCYRAGGREAPAEGRRVVQTRNCSRARCEVFLDSHGPRGAEEWGLLLEDDAARMGHSSRPGERTPVWYAAMGRTHDPDRGCAALPSGARGARLMMNHMIRKSSEEQCG